MSKSDYTNITLRQFVNRFASILRKRWVGKTLPLPEEKVEGENGLQTFEVEQPVEEPVFSPATPTPDEQLAEKIRQVMHEQQLWKDAELSITKLSKAVYSNKSYVTRCFREQMHTTFTDYVNRCRIEYVVAQLRLQPEQSLEQLFFEAGYRLYSTAWRNFTRQVGISPSEFITRLSHSQNK